MKRPWACWEMPFKISTSLVWDMTVLTAGMNLRELNLPEKGFMSNE